MRFLVDRSAGRRFAEWLGDQGHDVLDARSLGPDPGDRALLEMAASTGRVLITLDTDFGELIYLHDVPHAGLVRLPDVPTELRIALMWEVLRFHGSALEDQAIVTVRGERIRISRHSPGG